MQSYRIILDRDGKYTNEVEKLLSPFLEKYHFSMSKKVEVVDLTPLVQKMFPMINVGQAPGIPKSFNCLNTTLLTQGFLKRQSYSTADEFEYFMEKFCEEIPYPTDGSISYLLNRTIQHSRTNITSELSFEKPSNHKTKPYRLNYRPGTQGLIHYKCSREKMKLIKCSELNSKSEEVGKLDEYFYHYALAVKDSHLRKAKGQKIEMLLNQLSKYTPSSDHCEIKKHILINRLNSLESLNSVIQIEGINGDNNGFVNPKF